MNILLIFTSARGHAIAEAFTRSAHRPTVITISPHRNKGMSDLGCVQNFCDVMDFDSILEIAKKSDIDFACIGPEDPIGSGLADLLESHGIPCVSPTKSLARIEAGKGFTRDLMKKYSIDASPIYKVFETPNTEEIEQYLDNELGGNFVIKYDGLKGGKGVKVSGEHLHSVKEGAAYAIECIEECGRVCIEEKLIGIEFSLISFCSGTTVVDSFAIQDHKRAYNGDTGPNTGGMGTYSDANHLLPFLSQKDLDTASHINKAIAKALKDECKQDYKGILYGGFIAVKKGVKVIEYNCRFGDPEVLNILPLLKGDLVDICKSIIDGSLSEENVQFKNKATVCKYITPSGYPENKDQKGEVITFPDIPENARLYYGDIGEDEDGTLRLGGSRTAGIVGIGDTIEEAQEIADSLCKQVTGPVRFRSDIGTEKLLKQRVTTLEQIRS